MSLSFRLITTRFGHLGVVGDARRLRQVYLPQMWADGLRDTILRDFPDAVEDDRLQPGLADALRGYFAGQPVTFDARIRWDGTSEFVRTVCQTCRAIPYGQTVSYQQLAEQAGRPQAARAVGMAMRRNPCPIVVPCHRVLRSDGSLGGYCGAAGVELKRQLLEMEAAAIAQAGGLA